jgi:transposase
VRPRGNGQLKNALRQAAQSAARYDERSKAYYEKKRSEGRSHGQAISALARRRVDVMCAMLKNGEMYSS